MKKTSTVQLVRNATLKIRYAGHTMLIDPVLADKGTLISALGVNKTPRVHLTIPIQDIIGGVDMVLLTHNHIDHYEPSVPTHLPKEIPFYVQPQDADAIRNDGFTNVIPIEEIKTIDGISIYRTTGHHGFGQSLWGLLFFFRLRFGCPTLCSSVATFRQKPSAQRLED